MPAEPSRRISLEWNHNRRSRNASTWAVPLVSKRSWESQAEPQQVSDPAQRTQRVPPPRSRTGGTEFAAAEGDGNCIIKNQARGVRNPVYVALMATWFFIKY